MCKSTMAFNKKISGPIAEVADRMEKVLDTIIQSEDICDSYKENLLEGLNDIAQQFYAMRGGIFLKAMLESGKAIVVDGPSEN